MARLVALAVCVGVVLAGCANESTPGASNAESDGADPRLVTPHVKHNETAPATGAPVSADEEMPLEVSLSGCMQYNGGIFVSPYPPNASWFPPGLVPFAVAGDQTGTYGFVVWTCRTIALDNTTVEKDRSVVGLFAAANPEGNHPNASDLDCILLDLWTDSQGLANAMKSGGFQPLEAVIDIVDNAQGRTLRAEGAQAMLTIGLAPTAPSDPTPSETWRRWHKNVDGTDHYFDSYGIGRATGAPVHAVVRGEGGTWPTHVDGTPHSAVTNHEGGDYIIRIPSQVQGALQ